MSPYSPSFRPRLCICRTQWWTCIQTCVCVYLQSGGHAFRPVFVCICKVVDMHSDLCLCVSAKWWTRIQTCVCVYLQSGGHAFRPVFVCICRVVDMHSDLCLCSFCLNRIVDKCSKLCLCAFYLNSITVNHHTQAITSYP